MTALSLFFFDFLRKDDATKLIPNHVITSNGGAVGDVIYHPRFVPQPDNTIPMDATPARQNPIATIHQIGLPYHWGSKGRARGDAANELIGFVGDPNVSIQESKALTGNIEAGRRSRGRRVVTSGPLVPRALPDGQERDLPIVGSRPVGSHGIAESRTQQNEET